MDFLAIDFETANSSRNSACAIGLVKVINKKIVLKKSFLVKPPEKYFHWMNVNIHGITWDDVKSQPTFKQLWKKIKPHFEDVDFVVAHNAGFDKSVLLKTCEHYQITPPEIPFVCTVQLSKKLWNIYPTRLPDVCEYFGFDLVHHDALSDSEACAKIMLKAIKEKKYKYEHT